MPDDDPDDTFVRLDRGVFDKMALKVTIDAVGVDVVHALRVGDAVRTVLSLAAVEKLSDPLPLPVSETTALCDFNTVREESIVD